MRRAAGEGCAGTSVLCPGMCCAMKQASGLKVLWHWLGGQVRLVNAGLADLRSTASTPQHRQPAAAPPARRSTLCRPANAAPSRRAAVAPWLLCQWPEETEGQSGSLFTSKWGRVRVGRGVGGGGTVL
eukprot:jgi/Ulvmu1/6070/UM027_0048.1